MVHPLFVVSRGFIVLADDPGMTEENHQTTRTLTVCERAPAGCFMHGPVLVPLVGVFQISFSFR